MSSWSTDDSLASGSHATSVASSTGSWLGPAAAFLALLLSGCVTPYVAETRIHSDGSIDRVIWQPSRNAARVQDQQEAWDRIISVREPSGELPLSDLKRWLEHREAPPGRYLAAWGRFPSAAEIPDHATFPAPDGQQSGTLRRHSESRDLVFATEHYWEETLHDIVTLTGMREAGDSLAESLFDDFELLLNDHWGDQVDLSRLIDWLNSSGRSWLRESIEELYDTMARQPQTRPRKLQTDELLRRWAAIADRQGLHLLHPDGQVFGQRDEDDSELAEEAWNQFLFKLLQQTLVSLDGEPLTSERIQQLTIELPAILQRSLNESADAPEGIDSETWKSWQASQRRVFEQKYGDLEKAHQHYRNLSARVLGVFLILDHSVAEFDYTLEMPGTIVETSGRLQSEGKVRWTFSASEAFPFGYVMTSRSLMPTGDVQSELLGATPLDQRETLLEFATLVDQQPELLEQLEECRRQGNMTPWRTFQQELSTRAEQHPQTSADRRRLAAVRRLTELLQLEP